MRSSYKVKGGNAMKYEIKADLKDAEANGLIDIILDAGEEAALEYLIGWYGRRDGHVVDGRPWEDLDEVYGYHDEYVMAYSKTGGRALLVKVIPESSTTPGIWSGIEPDPGTYGVYRLKEAVEDQSSTTTVAESEVAFVQDTGNGRLMTAACNAFKKAAQALGVDVIELAEAFEKIDQGGIGELMDSLKELMDDLTDAGDDRHPGTEEEYVACKVARNVLQLLHPAAAKQDVAIGKESHDTLGTAGQASAGRR